MKTKLILLSSAIALFAGAAVFAQNTAFTYQGRLNTAGSPANGSYDFIFTLYTNSVAGNQIGNPYLTNAVPISNGLFTVSVDFGNIFNGTTYWLGISVRTNNIGSFTTLSPRQLLTPIPYALFSLSAASASNVVNGAITTTQLSTPGPPASGQVLAWNGSSLTWTNANTGGSSNSWSLTGNAGTTPGVDFVGTTDNEPLEFWVNGSRAFRLDQSGDVIGGGGNSVSSSQNSTISGGNNNIIGQIGQSSANSTIGGGINNTIAGNSCVQSVIAGGAGNMIESDDSTISGGGANSIQNAIYSTIPGGYGNTITADYSFAAGKDADAGNIGTFVWSDSTGPTESSGNNQFMVRCSGGAVFISAAYPNSNTGVQLAPGSGSWSQLSDRTSKDNFEPVNAEKVLEKVAKLPISTWSYKAENQDVRHIGPMAQDFYAAFKVGEDNKHIATIDSEGVALAAVQGLNEKLNEDMKMKDAEIDQLKQTVAHLETIVGKLSADQRMTEEK